jgi:tetratricopeptide (TPR) repeat protein
MDFEERLKTETSPTMKIKRADLVTAPETSAKASIPKADKLSPLKRPGSDIVKDSDHCFNRAFFNSFEVRKKLLKNYSKATKLNSNNPYLHNNTGVAYIELCQYYQSIEEFLKAIDLNQSTQNLITILAWYTMQNSNLKLSELELN